MSQKENEERANLVGVPEPQPPKGGPQADPDSPDPADLTPGFGGTSETKPESTDEPTTDEDDSSR